jgi:hypothetical protein
LLYNFQQAKIQKIDIRIERQDVKPKTAQFGTLKYLTRLLLCAHSTPIVALRDQCARVMVSN